MGLRCVVNEANPRIVVDRIVPSGRDDHEVVVWVDVDFGSGDSAPNSLVSGASWHVDVELEDGSRMEPLGSSLGAGSGHLNGRFPFHLTHDHAQVLSVTVRCADLGEWKQQL